MPFFLMRKRRIKYIQFINPIHQKAKYIFFFFDSISIWKFKDLFNEWMRENEIFFFLIEEFLETNYTIELEKFSN